MGRLDFADLTGPAASGVLVAMINAPAPGVLAGLLAAGVLAAVMSSLDSQVLAIGTIFTQDVVRHYGFHERMTEKQQILYARLFVTAILLMTFIFSLVVDHSIFRLAIWSFNGFASLFPVVVAALFWRRTSASGVVAGIFSAIALCLYFFVQSWSNPGYTVLSTGLMPVAAAVAGAAVVLVVVSLMTRPVDSEVLDRVLGQRGRTAS